MKRVTQFGVLLIAAFVAVLALDAMQGGAAANGVYTPPAGWHRTQVLARGLGTWVHPSDGQTITVQATNFSGSLPEFAQRQVAQIGQLPGVTVGRAQRATVCGTHPASYVAYQAPVNDKTFVYEQMQAIWSGVAYVATYAREMSQPSLSAARKSLRTLCGGGAASASPARTAPRASAPISQPAAPGTPYLGPSQAPATYGPPAPTVTPTSGP